MNFSTIALKSLTRVAGLAMLALPASTLVGAGSAHAANPDTCALFDLQCQLDLELPDFELPDPGFPVVSIPELGEPPLAPETPTPDPGAGFPGIDDFDDFVLDPTIPDPTDHPECAPVDPADVDVRASQTGPSNWQWRFSTAGLPEGFCQLHFVADIVNDANGEMQTSGVFNLADIHVSTNAGHDYMIVFNDIPCRYTTSVYAGYGETPEGDGGDASVIGTYTVEREDDACLPGLPGPGDVTPEIPDGGGVDIPELPETDTTDGGDDTPDDGGTPDDTTPDDGGTPDDDGTPDDTTPDDGGTPDDDGTSDDTTPETDDTTPEVGGKLPTTGGGGMAPVLLSTGLLVIGVGAAATALTMTRRRPA